MPEKNTYNFLLTNLSTVHPTVAQSLINNNDLKENKYYYSYNDNELNINGVMTNEPGIKAIMQELKLDDDYLDYIYYVKTESIVNPIFYFDKEAKVSHTYSISHEEFFRNRINQYCIAENIEKPAFPNVGWSDNKLTDEPTSQELINLSVRIATFILNLKENEAKDKQLNIYVEGNGGFRDFILVVTAVLRTLKLDNINIKKVMGVNFRTENEQHAKAIVDKSAAYNIFDFYSGIDEFINYGRITKMMGYYMESRIKTNALKNIRQDIYDMSNAFTLCRPEDMLKTIQKLKRHIDIYELKENKTNDLIIDYFVLRIKYAYKDVFDQVTDSDNVFEYKLLREMINYCLSHNLIQQALTLYSECMPIAFVNERIFYCPSDSKLQNNFNRFLGNNSPYRKEYVYVQQYMLYLDYHNINGKGLATLYNHDHPTQPLQRIPKGKEIEGKCKYLDKLLSNRYVGSQYLSKKDETIKVLENYLIIKDGRNMSNHANGENQNPEVKRLFKNIKSTVDFINQSLLQIDNLIS